MGGQMGQKLKEKRGNTENFIIAEDLNIPL